MTVSAFEFKYIITSCTPVSLYDNIVVLPVIEAQTLPDIFIHNFSDKIRTHTMFMTIVVMAILYNYDNPI